MKSVILCGGQGTRIRDVADNIPKPMIPIGNHPVLWHIMKIYAQSDINDFVLCLGYKGWVIKEFFLNYQAFFADMTVDIKHKKSIEFHSGVLEDWRVTLAETGEASQTGSRLWQVQRYLQDSEFFCVTYGDGVADIDVNALIAFHKSHGRIATVTGVRPAGRFGVMQTQQQDGFSVISEFQEKPQAAEGLINGGFFVFDQRLWKYLSADPDLIFEQEPLANLAKDGELVMFEHTGFWQPMDTFREWKLLNDLWASDNAPWRMW